MRRSGLVLLLGLVFLLSALCFDNKIAPPTLGLRRLFRRPYRGPICVIEIVGAELTPIANRGTARSLGPRGPRSRPHLPRPRCAPPLPRVVVLALDEPHCEPHQAGSYERLSLAAAGVPRF